MGVRKKLFFTAGIVLIAVLLEHLLVNHSHFYAFTMFRFLRPMHILILLSGVALGAIYGLTVGFFAPIIALIYGSFSVIGIWTLDLRTLIVVLSECLALGFFAGFFMKLPKMRGNIFVVLFFALLAGHTASILALFISFWSSLSLWSAIYLQFYFHGASVAVHIILTAGLYLGMKKFCTASQPSE